MDKQKIMDQQARQQERKITRTQQQYLDLSLKSQYLKTQKQIIKKQIQFYKSAINRLSFIYDIATD